VSFLLQVLRITVPYALAALGGALSERAGVVNIALEGTLLAGAFGAAVGSFYTGSPLCGLGCGVLCGMALQLLHALATVHKRADQIVSGLAANLLALGVTRFFLKMLFDSMANSPRIPAWDSSAPLLVLTFALALGVQALLAATRFGLRIRACGEHPEAAASLGVPVARVRTVAVVLAGALAGLGGVWLAFDQHKFGDNMSGGRGYVALAAMIFGRWRPLPAVLACLLFGFAEAAQIGLQASRLGLPNQLVQMLPYVLTIVALVVRGGRALAPASLGK
jgi:general nucleoside transport system permease protein